MSDTVAATKLTQYLSEAYAKEEELVQALEAHIAMTTRTPYKKRLQDHLKETKQHSRKLQSRIKKIGGGGPQLVDKVAGQALGKAKSLAKGPAHMLRGAGEAEKMLKNAKTEYWNEHEEIATYTAIETLAEQLGDKETAKLAREIRREEERMAKFLAAQIPVLTKAVVQEEVPASERKSSSSRRSSSSRTKASSTRSKPSSSRKKPSSTRAKASTRAKTSSARKRSTSSRTSARRKSGSRS